MIIEKNKYETYLLPFGENTKPHQRWQQNKKGSFTWTGEAINITITNIHIYYKGLWAFVYEGRVRECLGCKTEKEAALYAWEQVFKEVNIMYNDLKFMQK